MRRLSPRLQGMTSFRMPLSRRALFALPAFVALPSLADSWPAKPVHIVVPFAPGGSGDITARLVGKYIEDKTGQPFVVDNKPGANGIVGALAVRSAPADGYTLMLATASTNGALSRRAGGGGERSGLRHPRLYRGCRAQGRAAAHQGATE